MFSIFRGSSKILIIESLKSHNFKKIFPWESYKTLRGKLRMHRPKYLNQGLENKDWNEIEIRIYDRYGAYDIQYKRLLKVLGILELGIITDQCWGKDNPRPFMSIEIYRVRFVTCYEPKYIKKMLLALEYLEDGTRIVDYDVYFNRKKIGWTDVIEHNIRVRNELGSKFRCEVIEKLDEKEKRELAELENKILDTRK